jgi:hypothetical protein
MALSETSPQAHSGEQARAELSPDLYCPSVAMAITVFHIMKFDCYLENRALFFTQTGNTVTFFSGKYASQCPVCAYLKQNKK